ncbi:VOC family protein [Vibrio sp. 10N.261.55.A7]|uniref:VOC family protein n=1 Tax=Vibrio sp. 10N.261.55.A7 TaxID=1880851 RepID=UPI000CBA70C9|nr:VOC family protein [Vibrio sp. 10N.261.55.A7]PMJ92655.1 lactoylglutathione lyase [Vibrio sp. 10N.261.55.A7]
MKQNAIGWFDINVNDMDRAATFYEAVFNRTLEDMKDPTDSEALMKSFPTDMSVYGAGGALVKRQGAFPGVGGTLIYFGVADCNNEESRVVSAGGEVVQSKMSIGEFGWVSVCKDTEGNLFGLSSMS